MPLADNAVRGRRYRSAATLPLEFPALGLDLRLLRFGQLEPTARGGELSLRRPRRGFALIEQTFREMARLLQRLGPIQCVRRLFAPCFGLGARALGLSD